MFILFILLPVLLKGVDTSDTTFGTSVFIFEDQGAQSIIHLQRMRKGNNGEKYLNISLEANIDPLPYQLIISDLVLNPDTVIEKPVHQHIKDPIKLIVNYVDPCCGDNLIAIIEYYGEDDSLRISYENCDQTE
ncbi:hypothetical protein PFISCL1PPCAC_15740, partial [Pristionchus fissidentatus]